MKKLLNEIIKHIDGMNISTIRLIPSSNAISFEACANDQSIMLNGRVLEELPNVSNEFILGNLEMLSGLIKQPKYMDDDVVVEPVFENNVMKEIKFINLFGKESEFSYRLTPTCSKYQVSDFEWDIIVKDPSLEKIDEYNTMTNAMSKMEKYFTPVTRGKNLLFNFGSSSTHRAYMTFAENVDGSIKNSKAWNADKVLKVLKVLKLLDKTSKCDFKISATKGILSIVIDTGYAVYTYLLPGKVL